MTEPICLVAVDVGNSAVKLCVRRGTATPNSRGELIDFSVPIQKNDWHRTAIQWVQEHVGCQRSRWRIASVQRSAAKTLQDAVLEMDQASQANVTVDFISRHDVPMNASVDQPDRLGIDRLLSAFAAFNQLGAPLTIVDAGSAVTVDWVNPQGQFCGGAILPGLRMQAESLAKGTDALPEIDWQTWDCRSAAATNTVDAIRLGLMTGVSAAIDRLTELYSQSGPDHAGPDPSVGSDAQASRLVLTGGDAEAISPFVRHPHEVLPNLVCRGLLDLG